VATALAVTAIPVVLVYGSSCSGAGLVLGPRYLLFLVPLLLLPGVFLVDEAIKHRRVVVGALATAVFVLGIGVQAIGGSLYWDHYIRVEHNARAQWLGHLTGRQCDQAGHQEALRSLLRGFLRLNWLPPFSPLAVSTGWQAHLAGDSWDVPRPMVLASIHHHPLTDIAVPYARGRLDWWYLEFSQRPRLPGSLAAADSLSGGLLFGVFLCWWGTRRRQQSAAAVAETAPEPAA